MSPLLLSPSILDLFVAKSKTFSSLVSYEVHPSRTTQRTAKPLPR